MCKDFVTRNFFTALRQAVVPVVLGMILLVSFVICTSAHHRFQSLLPGNADYSKLAPPKSYIDVRDFENPSHLASYLKYLMDHPKEYDSYLEWSKSYRVLNNSLASNVNIYHKQNKLCESSSSPPLVLSHPLSIGPNHECWHKVSSLPLGCGNV